MSVNSHIVIYTYHPIPAPVLQNDFQHTYNKRLLWDCEADKYKQKFDRTEKLMERIIDVNSMASNEIINSEKIIEAERP